MFNSYVVLPKGIMCLHSKIDGCPIFLGLLKNIAEENCIKMGAQLHLWNALQPTVFHTFHTSQLFQDSSRTESFHQDSLDANAAYSDNFNTYKAESRAHHPVRFLRTMERCAARNHHSLRTTSTDQLQQAFHFASHFRFVRQFQGGPTATGDAYFTSTSAKRNCVIPGTTMEE